MRRAALAAALVVAVQAVQAAPPDTTPQTGNARVPGRFPVPGEPPAGKGAPFPGLGTPAPEDAEHPSLLRRIIGRASHYADRLHGRLTANGERHDRNQFTAAHRTLPMGTRVRVTALDSGRSVVVRINDRGPFSGGHLIDLSRAAAEQLGLLGRGTAQVSLEVLEPG